MIRILLLGACLSACATVPARREAPVAEVGVAFDRTGELASYAQGLADPAAGRLVTPDDPVRIASISKVVVAVGVMKLVEQGRLELDSDVSRWLGWSLRNSAFPDRPITLRMLLSHTSSLRDGDDIYVIPLGGSLRDTIADPTAWDPGHSPGSGYFKYANLNFPVIASIIELVTRERFDMWMRREVIEPMKLDACFNWPTCSDSAVARAVVLMQDGKPVNDNLGGQRPKCPVFVREGTPCDLSLWRLGENGALFSPQGGLRVSMRGLARIGRMLLGGGTIEGVRIVTPASVDTIFATHWLYDGRNGEPDGGFYCRYGLATHALATPVRGCADDPAGDGVPRVGHAGEAYGVRSGLWIDRSNGTGVAYFVSGLPADSARGRSAYRAAEEAALRRSLDLIRR
jgi:CubicO group peptidase (beta-lactamase class C family)